MKKILFALLMLPAIVFAQSYPSPTFQNVTVLGTLSAPAPTFSTPLAVSSGGTGAATASGTSLDNITGFASTGFLTRTGAGTYAFQSLTNGITYGNLAQAGANTLLGNVTGTTANVAAVSVTGCNGAAQALQYTSGSGFGCNSGIATSGANANITSLTGLTTPLSVSQGGTGVGSVTQYNVAVGGAGAFAFVGPNTANFALLSNGASAYPSFQQLTAPVINYTQGATGSAARTLQGKLQEKISILDFSGCDSTGVSDSTTCIQNAINANANGGEIDIPPGTYKISSTLTIGNGSDSAPSTINGLHIVGVGSGIASNEYTSIAGSVVLKWAGASGGTMMQLNGPIWGTSIEGIVFNANSLARSCLVLQHPIGGLFQNLECTGYTGPAFDHEAYAEPVGAVVGSSDNVFLNVMAKAPATGGSGIILGASAMGTTKQLDVARNTYINDHWDFDGQTSTSYGILLRFTDNNTFIENTTARANGGTGGFGLQITPPTGTGGNVFPGNIQFYNSPILGNVFAPSSASWAPAPGIGFWPYPTGDGEVVPSTNSPGAFVGITDIGVSFGGNFGSPVYTAAGANVFATHTVAGTVQLSAGAATVTFSGAAVFSNSGSYFCTATDESGAGAVKALMSSGTTLTLGGGGSDFVNYICIGN